MVRRGIQLEQLEKRLLLTVGVALDDGNLVIDGDATGDVAIVAAGDVYTVTDDDGDQVVEGVTGSIRITLEGEDEGANDNVTIDLGGGSVQNVSANLGGGDNSLSISNGSVDGRLIYRGGDGNDEVTVSAALGRGIYASMGDGDNSLTITDSVGDPAEGEDPVAEVGGGIIYKGGGDSDTVTVDEGAAVKHMLFARLGGGDNTVDIAGKLGSSLIVHGRDGADSVDVSGSVGRSVTVSAGNGENIIEVSGEIVKNLTVRAGDDADTVTITDTATIGGNVKLRLGGGDNEVDQLGIISGNLSVRTDNADDVINTDEGTVEGETTIELDVEREHQSFFERLLSRFRGHKRGDDGGGEGEGEGGEGDGGEGDDGDDQRSNRFRGWFSSVIERFRSRFSRHRGDGGEGDGGG